MSDEPITGRWRDDLPGSDFSWADPVPRPTFHEGARILIKREGQPDRLYRVTGPPTPNPDGTVTLAVESVEHP